MNGLDTFTTEQLQAELEERLRPHPPCAFCGIRPATLLCDFVIGFEWNGAMSEPAERHLIWTDGELVCKEGERVRLLSKSSPEMYTCDRPICRECATHTGNLHVSGKARFTDSIDRCPQCAAANEEERINPITSEEADIIRAAMWKRSAGILQAL